MHTTEAHKYPGVKFDVIKINVLKRRYAIYSNSYLQGTHDDFTIPQKETLGPIVKHDELSTGHVVKGDFNIRIKNSNTLCVYIKNTYNILLLVKLATANEGTVIDLISISRYIM